MTAAVIYTLIACLLVMLVSLSGVLFASKKLARWMERNLKYLISFSAGVFLVIAAHLTLETIEHTGNSVYSGLFILAGFVILHIISQFIPEYHHHHDDRADHIHSRRSAQRVIVGDAFHNVGDGIVIATAFLIHPFVGIVAAFGVLIHETIQEISEYFVLRDSGYSMNEALIRNFVSSSTIILGAVIGFLVADTEFISGIILGIAAGGFLYIAFADLIPRLVKQSRTDKKYARYIGAAILGIVLVTLISNAVGHGPEEADHDETEESILLGAQPDQF